MAATEGESLFSCVTTQLVEISGVVVGDCNRAAQDTFVDVFDDAMTAAMRLLEERIRGFGPDVVVRWGHPDVRGRQQIRRGRLEWVDTHLSSGNTRPT